MRVENVMTRPVWSCDAGDPLTVPARLMWEHDVGAVPVLGADGRVAGIITDRDVCMAAWTRAQPLAALTVGDHMSREVFTVPPEATLEEAEDLMGEHQVHRLPVVAAGGRLVGVVSLNDVAQAAAGPRHGELDAALLAAALSRVSEPRHAPLPGDGAFGVEIPAGGAPMLDAHAAG